MDSELERDIPTLQAIHPPQTLHAQGQGVIFLWLRLLIPQLAARSQLPNEIQKAAELPLELLMQVMLEDS